MSARSSGSVGDSTRRILERDRLVGIRLLERGRRRAAARVGAVDQAFEQAVRRQPIRAVQAAGGDFAGGPQPGERRAALVIDRHAADHVVGAGPHGDRIAGDVDAELGAGPRDAGKALADEFGIAVAEVEKDAGVPRLFHLGDDRLADDVARGELAARVVVGHEAVAGRVDEPRPFAAHRFGDQAAAAAGDVEHRRDGTA